MSKRVNKPKSNKLSEDIPIAHENSVKGKKIIQQIKLKEYPRSYRLDSEIIKMLKSTLNRINKVTPKKISEAKLIKALIILSIEIKEEEIIKALKEVW